MRTDRQLHIVRASLILTTSYVAGTVITNTRDFNQLIIYINLTKGDLTSLEVLVEGASDGTDFYQETASAVSGGTSTDTLLEHTKIATGKYRIAIPIKDDSIRISVKGTGTVTNSLVAVKAVIGIV